jgi:tripartite-type tricarboxylate transporter receptor subunit TctC
MTFARHRLFLLPMVFVAGMFLTISWHGASSQPTRTIRIVVPFLRGGTTDALSRILAEEIGRTQHISMIVENRAGAGAVIGTEAVSRSAPDGNTLLITATNIVTVPYLRKVNYDPLSSFEPVCQLTSTPIVLAVNSASRYRPQRFYRGGSR